MSDEKKQPVPVSEFDSNPALTPFKKCVELQSVLFLQGITLTGANVKRPTGLSMSDQNRLFIRSVGGVACVTHVDTVSPLGLPTNIPIGNIASFVTREEHLAREQRVQDREDASRKAAEAQRDKQRKIVEESEARRAQAHEAAQAAG